jgi:hypothetical protein
MPNTPIIIEKPASLEASIAVPLRRPRNAEGAIRRTREGGVNGSR